MDAQPIDVRHKLWQGLQFGLAFAPIVICRPVTREFLNGRQLHALRLIFDRFAIRPSGSLYALPQVRKFGFRNFKVERTNGIGVLFGSGSSPVAEGDISPRAEPWNKPALMSGFHVWPRDWRLV